MKYEKIGKFLIGICVLTLKAQVIECLILTSLVVTQHIERDKSRPSFTPIFMVQGCEISIIS